MKLLATLGLNKSSLQKELRQLDTYRRVLPALDLKRRQLRAQRNRAASELDDISRELRTYLARVEDGLPMLANRGIELTGLAEVVALHEDVQNIVGVLLPRFRSVEVRIKRYSPLVRPHWVDAAAAAVRQCVELKLRQRFAEERLTRLEQAARRITQRVNLFEKVLIPKAEAKIRKIRIYLADSERAAVVRSKFAQRKGASP